MRATSRFAAAAATAARKQRLEPGLPRMAAAAAATQLVPLPEVERLSPAVIRILGGNPGKFTLQGTNTYLVGTGRDRLLIDTGEGKPSWIAALKRVLDAERRDAAAAGGGGGRSGGGEEAQGNDPAVRIVRALITHRHHDHVGGIAQLLELSPATTVHKYRDPEEAGGRGAGGAGVEPSGGSQQGELEEIRDGQTFAVEGATLTAVHTPGHTADHVVFHLRESEPRSGPGGAEPTRQALFTGDNVLGHGTAVFEDLGTYLRSLARMQGLVDANPEWPALPGHGPVLPSARRAVAEYIEHRRQREAQVLRTLGSAKGSVAGVEPVGEGGPRHHADHADAWSSMELVKVIYRDVPENLHLPAQGGVVQVLRKLRDEGRVVLEGQDTWRLKDRPGL